MKIKKLTVVFFTFLIVYVCDIGNVIALECSHTSLPIASDFLITSDEVEVSTVEVDSWDGTTPAETDDNIYYAFLPKNTAPVNAFIILPGGNCDPRAYAPAAHKIASQGFLTVVLPMPLCVARADKIIRDFEEIEKWAIGGHSVGGTAACIYARKNGDIDGVIIWASLPPNRLDNTNVKVMTIYGSKDGRCGPESVMSSAAILPVDTVFVEIEGGNHTQFGYFDTSPNSHFESDNAATITLEEQQEIILNNTLDFLSSMPHNQQMSANESCSQQDTFYTNVSKRESVYVYGNWYSSLNGMYDFYLTENKGNWIDGDSICSPECVASKSIFINGVTHDEPSGKINFCEELWKPAIGDNNTYDIILDVNGNGVYDEGIDYVDINNTFVDQGCLAVYILGEDNPRLDTIRQFRDKVLAKNLLGRKMIYFYYKNEDNIILILDRHPTVKKSAREVLESLIPIMVKILGK